MANRFEAYRMRDGKTPLSASYFNAIWQDIDSRIGQIESLSAETEAAVNQLTELGIDRLEQIVIPLAEEAQGLIDSAVALLAAAGDPASNADLDAYTDRADDVTLTYDGNGRLETSTETYGEETKTVTLTYDGNDRVSTVETVWQGIRRTESLGYDQDGRVSTVTAAQEAV